MYRSQNTSRSIIATALALAAAFALPLAARAMPVAVIRAAQLPELANQVAACWAEGDGNTNITMNDNDHDRPSWNVRYSRDDCSMELRAEGKFTLRADLSDLETLSSDGWFRVEEREGRNSRRLEIRRGNSGSLDHQYWVNGTRANYDASARAWLARTLLAVERRTAFAATTRVPQLYRTGGLSAVLSEIAVMPAAHAKSRYYGELLDMGVTLDTNTLNGIISQASTDFASSDYYMSEVLGKFASQSSANETTWRTFAEAAGRMKSDYYKSQTLKRVLARGRLSNETVGTLLRSASGIKSDYYVTELLKSIAGKYAVNADTRPYYLQALRGIESDYYRQELLGAMANDENWDAKTSELVLSSVGDIKSDYYKAESLVSLVKAKHVDSWPPFFRAVSGMESDYYKKTVLTSVLKQSPLTPEIVTGVLSAAQQMKSDSETAEVLSAVARGYRIDDSLRPAFEKAVDSMESDYYRGSALSALRRSMAR